MVYSLLKNQGGAPEQDGFDWVNGPPITNLGNNCGNYVTDGRTCRPMREPTAWWQRVFRADGEREYSRGHLTVFAPANAAVTEGAAEVGEAERSGPGKAGLNIVTASFEVRLAWASR